MSETRRTHWDKSYSSKPDEEHSWFEREPTLSLSLIRTHAADRAASIIDVGAGASRLADALTSAGYRDLSLLDLSNHALELVRSRLGEAAGTVSFLAVDMTAWTPSREYDVWHDRAVFHFLVSMDEQDAYLRALDGGTHDDSIVIMSTFSPEGPDRCSGLPVQRYSASSLAVRLGEGYRLIEARDDVHVTPAGRRQAFMTAVFRKVPASTSRVSDGGESYAA